MKITITGATGFIGKHLVKSLKHHQLKLIDRTSKEESIEHNHETLVADLSTINIKTLKDFISGSDIIIHLAGKFTGNTEDSFKANTLTTLKLIEACKQANINKLIFASSYAVYGNNINKNDQCKETHTRNPITIYGLAKMMAEDILQYYSKQNNLKIITLRFPSIYGPEMRGGILYYILSAAKDNSILTINGEGSQLRNYVFIDDIIHYINLVINYNQKQNFEIINISNNQPCSVIQLLEIAESITNKKIQKTFSDDKPFSLLIDGTKAMNTFNYKPQVSLELGMQKTWEWFFRGTDQ
tara:strand:- start:1921 stop:2814 length:894 start_codon:yes stop_codon:yes gene_type:complete